MAESVNELGLDELNEWMREHNLSGGWMRVKSGGASSRDSARPEAQPKPDGCGAYVVRWSDLYPALLRGGELVPLPYGPMEMRTASGRDPRGTARPISMGLQILMPGERTRAHRNMKNETRLVLQAPPEATFVCDGESFPMQRGDVVVSPTWTDHDHWNPGSEPAIWLEAFDWGYSGTGVELNERYSVDDPYQKVTRPEGHAIQTLRESTQDAASGREILEMQAEASSGSPYLGLSPQRSTVQRPAIRYPWADTHATLEAVRANEVDEDPYEGFHLMFNSPVDGGPTTATIAWHAQLLTGRRKTGAHRHNSTTFYHVFQGEGSTEVEGERIDWSQGDIFLVPPWTWHRHENRLSDDAILFSVDDWPARSVLGFYREEKADL
jgi:gentisate 1,2-dioxygenase